MSRLDEEPLRTALAALLELDGSQDAWVRLSQVANAAGLERSETSVVRARLTGTDPREGWIAARIDGGFALRWTGEEPFELQILGDTVRIVTWNGSDTVNAARSGEAPAEMEEALDASAGPVFRWLRASGHRPAQASRLAALYAPRLRGSSWPSSRT